MNWGVISLIVGIIFLGFIIIKYRKKKVVYKYEQALLSPDEMELKNLLNGYRQLAGLSYLRSDKAAGYIAYKHCLKMVNEQRVFHNLEDGRYDDLKGASNFVEIVNGEFYNVKTCFDGFMKSPDHFRIINGNYNTIGLSVERDDDNKVYATVIFFRI